MPPTPRTVSPTPPVVFGVAALHGVVTVLRYVLSARMLIVSGQLGFGKCWNTTADAEPAMTTVSAHTARSPTNNFFIFAPLVEVETS